MGSFGLVVVALMMVLGSFFSVRWYSTTPELTGTDENKRKAGRFVVMLATRRAAGGPKIFRKSEFAVCGTSDAIVERLAVIVAENIARFSDGVIVGMSKVMGHYRRDEVPVVVETGKSEYGSVTFNNYNLPGIKLTTRKIMIPWCGDAVTRADLKLMPGALTDGGDHAELGAIHWDNQDTQTELDAFYCSNPVGAALGDYTKETREDLVNDDVSGGAADGRVSEKFVN